MTANDFFCEWERMYHELRLDHSALTLSRDLARQQLSRTIAERDAERAVSDALAEALRDATDGEGWVKDATTAALARYDAAR